MRGWKTEIGQHAVAHISGNVAVVASNGIAAMSLKSTQNLTQIFRIELGGQCRGADDVAKQNGQVSPLSLRTDCFAKLSIQAGHCT